MKNQEGYGSLWEAIKNHEQYDRMRSIILFVSAIIASGKNLLSAFFGVDFSSNQLDATADFILAVLIVIAAYKNNYLGKKGSSQMRLLERAKLQ